MTATPAACAALSFCLLLRGASSAFAPRPLPSTTPRPLRRRCASPRRAISGGGAPLLASMVVIGDVDEALSTAMALCSRDVLLSRADPQQQQSQTVRSSPVPPAQPVCFFMNKSAEQDKEPLRLPSETVSSIQNAILFLGPPLDSYEQILASALQLSSRVSRDEDGGGDPILYSSIDFGCESGSKDMEALNLVRHRFSFMGLNLNTVKRRSDGNDDGRFAMTREDADEWGNKLHTLLVASQLPAAVTMDVRTHLALLQANSLPKSRGVLGEKDVWAITDVIRDGLLSSNDGGMLLEYEYDYSDPFGGCDPLLRPSTGYLIPPPKSSKTPGTANDGAHDAAYAAAYSAMVGSGMDPLSSISVAVGVKAVYRELGYGNGSHPAYTWNTIDRVVEYSLEAAQSIMQEDGMPRKMYREFGYR